MDKSIIAFRQDGYDTVYNILEYLERYEFASVSEIARNLDPPRPQPRIHKHMKELEKDEFVAYDDTKRRPNMHGAPSNHEKLYKLIDPSWRTRITRRVLTKHVQKMEMRYKRAKETVQLYEMIKTIEEIMSFINARPAKGYAVVENDRELRLEEIFRSEKIQTWLQHNKKTLKEIWERSHPMPGFRSNFGIEKKFKPRPFQEMVKTPSELFRVLHVVYDSLLVQVK